MPDEPKIGLGALEAVARQVRLPIGLMLDSVTLVSGPGSVRFEPFEIGLTEEAKVEIVIGEASLQAFLTHLAPGGLEGFRVRLAGGKAVVDFDAAIAFSAIGREGDFLGAAIAPGVDTALESLRASAALLPEVQLEGPVAAIGKNTPQSIRAGICIGYAGLVDRVARSQAEELVALGEADSPDAVTLLGTGGEEGRAILAAIGRGRFIPDMVLEGIAIIAAKNKGAATVVV